MTRTKKLVCVLLAASVAGTLLGACSSSTSIPTITVNSITAESTIGGLAAPTGTYLAQVSVTMANDTPTALPGLVVLLPAHHNVRLGARRGLRT